MQKPLLKMKKERDLKFYHGVCSSLSFEGKGVLLTPEKEKILVKGLFVGEEADVEVLYKRNGLYYGKIKHLFKMSEKRVPPLCPVHNACGGCSLDGLSYDEQLLFKKRVVEEQLFFHTSRHFDVKDVISAPNTVGRNKIQVPFGYDRYRRKAISGFYRENTHEIIENENCVTEMALAKRILKSLNYLVNKYRIAPYDEENGTGYLRHALVRISSRNKAMLVLVVNDLSYRLPEQFISELKKDKDIETCLLNLNDQKTNVVLGKTNKCLWGKGYLDETFHDLKFRLSPQSFFQTNHAVAELLVNSLLKEVEDIKGKKILDAYSGIGTIGLSLASEGHNVIAVEIMEEAVADAKYAAQINGISSFSPFVMDSTEFIMKEAQKKANYGAIILDPPRKGTTEEFLKAVLTLMPEKVIYVSCDPKTLGRDLVSLLEKYDVDLVQPFDMFPYTHHVETLVVLKQKLPQ